MKKWTSEENKALVTAVHATERDWIAIGIQFDRTAGSCMSQYKRQRHILDKPRVVSALVKHTQPVRSHTKKIQDVVNDRFLSLLWAERKNAQEESTCRA